MSKIDVKWTKSIRILEWEAPDGMTDHLSVEVVFYDEEESRLVRDAAADAMRRIQGASVDVSDMTEGPSVRASFGGGILAPRRLAKESKRVREAICAVDDGYADHIEVRRVTYAEQKAARKGG